MNSRIVASITGTLFWMLFAPAISQGADDWVDIKDPAELRALFSNKTFRAKTWVNHNRADGKATNTEVGGRTVPRTWEVKGKDQVCYTTELGSISCWQFQRNRKNKNDMLMTNVDSKTTLLFTLEDGIPKF